MNHYIELVTINGDWEGGHHGQYPKVFSVSPGESKPFVVTEGSGWGFGGSSFTIAELFEQDVASIFDREESSELFQLLWSGYQSGVSSEALARELIERYEKHA